MKLNVILVAVVLYFLCIGMARADIFNFKIKSTDEGWSTITINESTYNETLAHYKILDSYKVERNPQTDKPVYRHDGIVCYKAVHTEVQPTDLQNAKKIERIKLIKYIEYTENK